MPASPADLCVGPLDPLCQAAGGLAGSVGTSTADMVLGGLGNAFVTAAQAVSRTALAALDATTAVDLSASWFTRNMAVIAAVTLPAVVGLFVLQVLGSVLRREPGGLVRALTGVVKATVGAAVAIGVTQVALTATDGICQVIAASAGTTVAGAAGRFLQLSALAGPGGGPVLQMLLGTAVLVGSLLLWAVLLFRKAAVLLVAVFAPVAFAGAVWDQTRVWTRRWIEAVAALVLCKIVIVVVFVVGVAAFGSDGTTAGGAAQPSGAALSDLLVGLVLLSIAVFAPWLTWRFVHWSGMEAGTAVHSAVAASPVPAAARSGVRLGQSAAMSAVLTPTVGGAAAALRRGASAGRMPPPAPRTPPPAAPAGPVGGRRP